MRITCGSSLMFQATTNSTAARQHRGMAEASGASSRMTRIKNTECTTPASGLVAPLRILVAVRANRARGGKSAEQRRHDIGNTLTYEFLVGIVPRSRHSVGDHGRQQ